MNSKRVILWFRNDLRLHDNEALIDAMHSGGEVYPVYVFDDRITQGKLPHDLRKMDIHRAQHMIDSVVTLRDRLRTIGSDLIILRGLPEKEIFQLAKRLGTSWVYCNRERTSEEEYVQDQLENNLWSIGQEVRYSRGKMLYYTADLPFPVTHSPDTFTSFRKELEKIVMIREPMDAPTQLEKYTEEFDCGTVPVLQDWGYTQDEIETFSPYFLKGGEVIALQQLENHISALNQSAEYPANCLNQRSVLSPYLSAGSLSPKLAYANVIAKCKPDIAYQFYLALLHRDHCRLMGKKYGNAIFQYGGQEQRAPEGNIKNDITLLKVWCEGRTGVPIVDAIMTQLKMSGHISKKARIIAGDFLINYLKINWQMGARYFESRLVDYDPCSNWVNWNILAGIDMEHKESRPMNVINSSKKYDPHGHYIRKWLPALAGVPESHIHQPYLLTEEEQTGYACQLQKDYPRLCLPIESMSTY